MNRLLLLSQKQMNRLRVSGSTEVRQNLVKINPTHDVPFRALCNGLVCSG